MNHSSTESAAFEGEEAQASGVLRIGSDAGDVPSVLDRLRTRLLDLTLSNRLLNFKQDGARVVRVIDELPDQLFSRLLAGAELELGPLPNIPVGHPLLAGTADPDKRALRAAAAGYARELGLEPSYELPKRSTTPPTKHADNIVQTLVFPPDLERVLRAIANDARAAIDEKGSNILYMVFGFLEWYEADSSAKSLLAPLVMLPVSLKRGEPDRKTSAYRFYISYSNEDVLPNISLQEKLRRDRGIVLPDLEDDELPESYFERLGSLAFPERWAVRRQISLGLLSFSKLFMYRDLDPEAWPKGHSPAEHARVVELLGGAAESRESGTSPNIGEYDFEGVGTGPEPPVTPAIVIDADSSQHSAIVDAYAGKNLVIEGPPGTGKSQTIANVIASALSAGKTVLFVAEKVTALEVVKRRLDECGLGAFCLELHSDKTQKARLMEELKARLESKGTLRAPREIEERKQVVQGLRQKLNSYVVRVNRPACAMGWSVHDVLWGAQRRRSQLGDQAELYRLATLPQAHEWNLARYEELRRCTDVFANALQAMRDRGPIASHPFWGVWSRRVDAALERELSDALDRLAHKSTGVCHALDNASHELEGACPQTADAIEIWIARTRALQQLSHNASSSGLRALEAAASRRAFAEWLERVSVQQARRAEVERRLPVPDGRSALLELNEHAFAGFSPTLPMPEVVNLPHEIELILGDLRHANRVVQAVTKSMDGVVLPTTLGTAVAIIDLVACLRHAPFRLLGLRVQGGEETDRMLEHAARVAASLVEERRALSQDFDLALLPDDPSILESHAATCATANVFSRLGGTYREARRQYAAIAKRAGAADDHAMSSHFRALASFQKRQTAFANDGALRAVLGGLFQAVDTPFDRVFQVRHWQNELRALQYRHRGALPGLVPLAEASVSVLGDIEHATRGAALPQMGHLTTRVMQLLSGSVDPAAAQQMSLDSLELALRRLSQAAGPLRNAIVAQRGHLPTTLGEFAGLHRELRSVQRLQEEVDSAELPRAVLGQAATHPLQLGHATLQLASAVFADETPDVLRAYFVRGPMPDGVARCIQALTAARDAVRELHTAEQHFLRCGEINLDHWYGAASARGVDAVVARTKQAIAHRAALPSWISYLRARVELFHAGGDCLRDIAERDSQVELSKLTCAAEWVVHASIAARVFATDPELAQHDGMSHSAIRDQFRAYDKQLLLLERERIAAVIDARPVPSGTRGSRVKDMTERALLEHEVRKQRAHAPIRQLVNRAGGALLALKPCFMMSPRSVAQYLKAGTHEFDLVVMDEASQLRPEDAFGSVARGKQLVVVGDSKQLPPTSFFTSDSSDDDAAISEDEETIADNKESILDLARTVSPAVRQLRWHYRSRHGSLIAFSNDRYYDGSLIVFPSAHDEGGELGVRLVHVDNALFEERRNRVEAESVVAAVIDHLRTRSDESLGIVALNITQRDLIQAMLYERLKSEPELRERFERKTHAETGFVKNLEAVQGDERDVIFISMTYGPSSVGGPMARRFGPLNGDTGWRRLNVLFTRARRRVVVFASFAPEALGDQGLSRGARDLRDYIAFARTGQYQQSSVTNREPDSDFEVEVAEALRSHGYAVVPQVGVAGYFIDLGVCSPGGDGRFLVGIECDGARYHSSFSARDRDRLRQQVLEGLGWSIHRIWSTDWYRDNRAQRQRLIEAVRAAEHAQTRGSNRA